MPAHFRLIDYPQLPIIDSMNIVSVKCKLNDDTEQEHMHASQLMETADSSPNRNAIINIQCTVKYLPLAE